MDFTALIQELGIDKMSKDAQKAILEQLVAAVHTAVGMRLADELTEEQQKQLEAIEKERGHDAALEELARMYPDIAKIYQEEVDKAKEDMKALM